MIDWRDATIFSLQWLSKNQDMCYLGRVVGKEAAPRAAKDGEVKGEERIFIWNRNRGKFPGTQLHKRKCCSCEIE